MTTYKESRRSLLGKVHIAAKELGLDDETYRAMLEDLTGHRTAKDCPERQLVMILAALRKRGWNPKKKKAPVVRPELDPLLSKVEALLVDMDKRWPYAEAIARHMFGVGLSWCDASQVRAIVTALVKQRQKVAAEC